MIDYMHVITFTMISVMLFAISIKVDRLETKFRRLLRIVEELADITEDNMYL